MTSPLHFVQTFTGATCSMTCYTGLCPDAIVTPISKLWLVRTFWYQGFCKTLYQHPLTSKFLFWIMKIRRGKKLCSRELNHSVDVSELQPNCTKEERKKLFDVPTIEGKSLSERIVYIIQLLPWDWGKCTIDNKRYKNRTKINMFAII